MDWRDGAAYSPLLGADRSILAWEWLRRDPGYRAAAEHGGFGPEARADAAARWGLHALEPADRALPQARPIWRADVHPLVLTATAWPAARAEDAFDPAWFGSMITSAGDAAGEHVLVSDGLRAIRIDLVSGTLRGGPVELHYRLAGCAAAERPLLTLKRLLAFCRNARFSSALHPPDARMRRFILLLRAHDALEEGATQREIAATLLSAEAAAERWRVNAPTMRTRAQRLVQAARRMAGGGYRALLG